MLCASPLRTSSINSVIGFLIAVAREGQKPIARDHQRPQFGTVVL